MLLLPLRLASIMKTSNSCKSLPNMFGSMETFLITALKWKGESVLFCPRYSGLPVDMPYLGNICQLIRHIFVMSVC